MKPVLILLTLACVWTEPAVADETWKCPDGRYTILDDHPDQIDRDEPPLSYKVVQNDDIGIVAVVPDDSTKFVGMAGIILRKSDGTLLRFGHAFPANSSKTPALIGGSRIERCHQR